MKTVYSVEVYNKVRRMYQEFWVGYDIEMAQRMYSKSYYKNSGKVRVVRTIREIILEQKPRKKQ